MADRYEVKALQLDAWIKRHFGVPEHYTARHEIAAALKEAAEAELQRAMRDLALMAQVRAEQILRNAEPVSAVNELQAFAGAIRARVAENSGPGRPTNEPNSLRQNPHQVGDGSDAIEGE